MTRPGISTLRPHALPLLLLLAASLAAIVPLLVRGPSCGHDFDFHLLSWIETATDWHNGLVYPHWLMSANFGAGEPRFIFYPPISWLLGAALGTVAGSAAGAHAGWTAAPILFTWIAIFAAGCAVYALALSLTRRTPAALGACLFVANPYLLFVAYERTAYAELLATALIALLLLLALRHTPPVLPLSLVVAALWLTNAPAAVMGCYALAFVAALRVVLERRPATALRCGAGCVAGIALAGFYLVPAAWEQRWVQIERAVSQGMRVDDSFLFGHTGLAYHDEVLHTASLLTVALFSIAGAALAFVWLKRRGRQQPGRRPKLILSSLLLVLFLLQLRISSVVWHLLPRLLFLQFPWRWLVVVSILAAVAVAMALDCFKQRALPAVAVVVIAGVSLWTCAHRDFQACDVDDAVAGQLALFHDGSGVEGTDEYTARDADNSEVLQDMPQVRILRSVDAELPAANAGDNPEWLSDFYFPTTAKATTRIEDWTPVHRRIQVSASEPAFAILSLMDYPAWQVTLNGVAQTRRPHRDDGLIALAIPAGSSTIDVRWRATGDIYAGWALSGLAAFALFLYAGLRQRFSVRSPA